MAAALILLLVPACSDAQDEFCSALEAHLDLTALRRALDSGDDKAVTRSLKGLQEVRDLAPPDIAPATEKVIDTAIDTVRRVTEVTGPNGETMPVDTTELNRALAEIPASAQELRVYADEKCGFALH
jgi:hypothetical protein